MKWSNCQKKRPMTSADLPNTSTDPPALYDIRVRGCVSDTWSDLAEDMTLQVVYDGPQPVTVLRAVVNAM
jgi:hypothetical protein